MVFQIKSIIYKNTQLDKTVINIIIKKFIIFQTFDLIKQFEKNFAKYPRERKNKKDAIDAPMPKKYLFATKKFFEKLPKKNTVSE